MRLFLDTNVFLEILLDQDRVNEAKRLLLAAGEHELFMSDYSLHSIGLVLFHRKQHDAFRAFLQDAVLDSGVGVVSLFVEDHNSVAGMSEKFNLDFDDAYQYTIAEKHDLTIVSFDSDFDRTVRGRKTPAQILSKG